MGKKAIHFFIIIQPHSLEEGSLVEIPPEFVNKYGKCLKRHVFLKPPKGAVHKVELRRSNGQVWLHKGWQDFVHHCSINRWYLLLFEYEGKSSFHVLIFDPSCSEIEYPVVVDESEEADDWVENLDEQIEYPVVVDESEEADDSVENLDEQLVVPMANLHSRGHGDVISAREIAFERATAFKCPTPHFTVTMRQAYISNSYLHVPKCARSYFDGRDQTAGLSLKGPDGRTWPMEYYYVKLRSQSQVRIGSGWKEFVQEYDLQEGDTCVFELINISTVLEFNIAIFQTEEEDGTRI